MMIAKQKTTSFKQSRKDEREIEAYVFLIFRLKNQKTPAGVFLDGMKSQSSIFNLQSSIFNFQFSVVPDESHEVVDGAVESEFADV